MATEIKYIFQLVNVVGQFVLDASFGDSSENDYRYMDWDLTVQGDIRKISKQDAMVQSALKCVFSEKQLNGYGSNLYDLIGEKDIIVRRTGMLMDLSMSIIAAKSFNDSQAVVQNLSPDDLIASISKFLVMEDPDDVSKSIVKMTLLTNSNVPITVGVL